MLFELIELLLKLVDPRLVCWFLVINVIGYWLKKKGLPDWCPPLPLVLFLISFVICTLFGWAVSSDLDGAKSVVLTVFFYGLGNGLAITLFAIGGYDTVHGFFKKSAAKKAAKEVA